MTEQSGSPGRTDRTNLTAINPKLMALLTKVAGESEETVIRAFADKLIIAESARQVRFAEKCRLLMAEKMLSNPQKVPLRLVIGVVENGVLEPDDELQDLWCSLFVSSADDGKAAGVRHAFVDILKQMDRTDARILDYLFRRYLQWIMQIRMKGQKAADKGEKKVSDGFIPPHTVGIEKDRILRHVFIEGEAKFYSSIDNLARIGCVAFCGKTGDAIRGIENGECYQVTSYEVVTLTALGLALADACMPHQR